MKYRLIALDLDGTLLNDEKKITPKTEKMLLDAQKCGVKVAIATGRMPFGVKRYAQQLRLKEYGGACICFNGGLVVNACGETIDKRYLDKKYLKFACEITKETDITAVVHKPDRLYANSNRNNFTDIAPRIIGVPMIQVEDLFGCVSWDIHKIVFVGELKKLKRIEKILKEKHGENLEIVFSTPWFLEIMPKGVSKGEALKTLSREYGFDISQTIACGDNYNDSSMIETAGIGVVMKNGEEELKKIADYVTHTDCNNDGISEVVNKYIFGKI